MSEVSRKPNAMNMREHLALAATQMEIPEWFEPKLPPLPELPACPSLDSLVEVVGEYKHFDADIKASSIIWASMSRFIKKLQDQEDPGHLDLDYPTLQKQFGMPVDAIDDVYDSFYFSVEPYRKALTLRSETKEKLRLAQWPWAYADLVLSCQEYQ